MTGTLNQIHPWILHRRLTGIPRRSSCGGTGSKRPPVRSRREVFCGVFVSRPREAWYAGPPCTEEMLKAALHQGSKRNWSPFEELRKRLGELRPQIDELAV
jgi:hypothetical protein